MSGFAFAHVSDLHLPFEPALSPRQRLSKRQLSAWSWQRRRALHRSDILDALALDLRTQAVDHILITGDVTNFSLPGEFVQAAEWLTKLAPPERISLNAGMTRVDGRCGPRHRSFQRSSPDLASRLS